jgi:hypothetical protein
MINKLFVFTTPTGSMHGVYYDHCLLVSYINDGYDGIFILRLDD